MNVSSSVALCPTNNTALCLSMKECLNHSGPPEECFWNQNSRVTGIFCEECVKLCRSHRTSLNFVQLLIGLLLFTPACPISRITLTILASDGMGTSGQVSLHVPTYVHITLKQGLRIVCKNYRRLSVRMKQLFNKLQEIVIFTYCCTIFAIYSSKFVSSVTLARMYRIMT